MKTGRNKIIEANRSLFAKIVRDIRPGDDANLVSGRVGDRLTVTPDDPPNAQERITVVFRLESTMAVSKGANLAEIIDLLSMAPNAGFAALGTSLTGAMAAGVGVAEASVSTLGRIMSTQTSQDNIKLLIPLTDVPDADPDIKLKAEVSVEGWTRTNDWDGDEKANFSYHIEVATTPGNVVKTENVGASTAIEIDSAVSTITKSTPGPEELVAVDLGWDLSTDGAFTHDTISLIQISSVSVTLEYV